MRNHLTALAAMLAVICTLTACAPASVDPVGSVTVQETADVTEASGQNGYVSYEDALIAYYGYVADEDYDSALSVMMPEKICTILHYMHPDEEIVEEYFDAGWDIDRKIAFQEVLSEETLDDEELQRLSTALNAELYSFDQVIAKYDQLPAPEELEEEIYAVCNQIMESAGSAACPDYVSELHKVNVHLTDRYDVDFYHTAVAYRIGSEGWRVIEVEEAPKDEWEQKIMALSDMDQKIWSAAADALNSAYAENKFGLAEKDWSQPCAVSPDPELCFRFDSEAARSICEEIVADVEGAEDYDFFIALSGSGIDDIIICAKDDHHNICITPSGCIDIGEDYENASDLTYEKACQLYLQTMGG